MFFVLFSVLIFLTVNVNSNVASEMDSDEMTIDPYHLTVKYLDSTSTELSATLLNKLLNTLFGRFKCTSPTSPTPPSGVAACSNALCLSSGDIFTYLGIASGKNILEDDFDDLSNLLLYYLLNVNTYCHQTVTDIKNNSYYQNGLSSLIQSKANTGTVRWDDLQELLDDLDDTYDENDHDDDDDDHDDHGDHDDHDHDDDHHDDHDDDDHHVMSTIDADDHDHTDDHDHITQMTTIDHDHDDDHDNDHDDHDDTHDSHEDDHDDEVHETKCISARRLFDEIHKDPNQDDLDTTTDVSNIAQLMLYYLVSGAKISKFCRTVPRSSDVKMYMLNYLGVKNGTVTENDVTKLLEKLSLTKGDQHVDEDDHSGHDHRRKRRALESEQMVKAYSSRRVKRAVADPNLQTYAPQCYSADQLLAINNIKNPNNISQAQFFNMFPSIIYQQITKGCEQSAAKPLTMKPHPTMAERYGYGTLAVLIICLCSIAGVVVLPCARGSCKGVYRMLLSIFLGLAVGTLVTDAVLHLIPTAFGLHAHDGDDHDHGDEVKLEPYVSFGLAAIAGIYAFYIIETVFNLIGKNYVSESDGHGHSHMPFTDVELEVSRKEGKSNGYRSESKSTLYEVTQSQTSLDNNGHAHTHDNTLNEKKGWTPVAIMVVVGDALHNFADGLAIGAAFTEGNSTGIATSVTVFCHEFPHELGDFSILLTSGLGMKKALGFNLLSSLTAFIGLYIGLEISTDAVVRQWIFAVTAGLFLYIALADMLPVLVQGGTGKRSKRAKNILLNNIGIFIGVGILVILSLYEEQIKV